MVCKRQKLECILCSPYDLAKLTDSKVFLQHIPGQGGMLPLEWRSAPFTFTIVFLKMCKLSLESINTTKLHKQIRLVLKLQAQKPLLSIKPLRMH